MTRSDRRDQNGMVSRLRTNPTESARPIPSAATVPNGGAVQVSFNAREPMAPPLPTEVATMPIEIEQFVIPRSMERNATTHAKRPALRRFKNLAPDGIKFQENAAHLPPSDTASSDPLSRSSVGQPEMIAANQMNDRKSEPAVASSMIINGNEVDGVIDSTAPLNETTIPSSIALHPFEPPHAQLGEIDGQPLNTEVSQSPLSRLRDILESSGATSSQAELAIEDNDAFDISATSDSTAIAAEASTDHHTSSDSTNSVTNNANKQPLQGTSQNEQSMAVRVERDAATVEASNYVRAASDIITEELTDSTPRLREYNADPKALETELEDSNRPELEEARTMRQYISARTRHARDPRRLPTLRDETQSLSPRMQTVIRRANRNIRYAFALGSRGAVFSARAEFIKAIRLVAQSLDETNQTNVHSRAVTSGLLALQEADDFILQDSSLIDHLDVKTIAAGHNTHVLHGIDTSTVSPFRALQMYYEFAKRQLALAGGRIPASSMALYGLARIEAHISREENGLSGPKAIVLNQAALLVDENNYLASNQLGVLFARFGQLDRAQVALSKSLSTKSYRPTWHNLSVVYRRMGEVDLAEQAASRARVHEHTPGSQIPNPTNTSIRWVDLATFNAAADQSRAPQPQSNQPQSNQPPVDRPTTTSHIEPQPKKGFFKRFSFKTGNGNTAPQPEPTGHAGSNSKP